MKRLLGICIIALVSYGLQAQSGKVYNAFNNFNAYNQSGGKDKDVLLQGLEDITEASVHEGTKDDPKTWYYKGYIHQLIFQDSVLEAQEDGAIIDCANSYMQAIKLSEVPDAKKFRQMDETVEKLGIAAGQLHNYGIIQYKAGDAANAYLAFSKAVEVYDFLSSRGHADAVHLKVDDSRFLAATVGVSLEKYDEAKAAFTQLMDNGYDDVYVYKSLASIYSNEKNYDKALEVLQKGMKAYPDDASVSIDMINIYLQTGRETDAIDIMNKAIEQQPDNPQLYFVLANTYGKLGQEDKMLETYNKAIEVDPTYADAYNNLGAYYLGKANEIVEKMNDPKVSNSEYEALDKDRLDYLGKALPFLEKANDMKPNNLEILDALKVIYAKLGQYDKSKAIKQQIEKIQAGG